MVAGKRFWASPALVLGMAVGLVVALIAAQGRGTKVTHIETKHGDDDVKDGDDA